ncbi:MAG: site-specific integrase, partial [Chloroflexota bacterium]
MAALADLQRGLPVPPERQSVGEFLERWLKDVVAPSVRPRTFASYSQLVRRHLLPTLGRVRLVRLTAQDIQACLNQKRQEGLSARTVQYLHAILRRALGQAEKWGLVARNVARLVDAPKVVRPEVKPLAPEDVRRLLDAARGDSLEALYVVAIAVGLRQGELLGLRWQDVDLERGLLSVRVQLTEPKSSRSKRTVQLPAVALKALR